jgi:hypothetical protein
VDWNQITQNWDEMVRRMRPTSSLTPTCRAKPLRSNPVNGLEEMFNPITQATAATPDAWICASQGLIGPMDRDALDAGALRAHIKAHPLISDKDA